MSDNASSRLVEAMPWLDTAARNLQNVLTPVLGPSANRRVKDALYGTWLGHPLHPALVSLPLGFWTSTTVLDLAGMESGADLTLRLGLVSALGAVASGAAQWQDTQGLVKPRRLGVLHALLNTSGAAFYGASWWLRARGSRKAGVTVSIAGFAIVSVSAWLGGDLAYDLGIGINRTAFEDPLSDWVEVLDGTALQENEPVRVVASNVPVMLLRQHGEIYAMAATCTHLGGPLDKGAIDGDTVTCPWHGSVFCVRDGALIHGPATAPEPAFDVRVENGRISVRSRASGETAHDDRQIPNRQERKGDTAMVSFGKDIRPLFRDNDVSSMMQAFDLSNYESVKDHAEAIYGRVANGTMPCDGAWPQRQIALLRAWIDGGCLS